MCRFSLGRGEEDLLIILTLGHYSKIISYICYWLLTPTPVPHYSIIFSCIFIPYSIISRISTHVLSPNFNPADHVVLKLSHLYMLTYKVEDKYHFIVIFGWYIIRFTTCMQNILLILFSQRNQKSCRNFHI